MDKSSIYKLIGYNGEYNASVKKAIRKLLKDNHPDKNGDPQIFKLINEVKDEIENNKVSYNYKKKTKKLNIVDDIDYDYCLEMMEKKTREKNIYTNTLQKKNERLLRYIKEYEDLYKKNIELETFLLSNKDYKNKLNNTKVLSICFLLIAIIVFIISIFKESLILFILFLFITIFCVLNIQKFFFVIQKVEENNQNHVKNYVKNNSRIRYNKNNQEKLKKEINNLEKRISNLENDLRFYNNIFNSKE